MAAPGSEIHMDSEKLREEVRRGEESIWNEVNSIRNTLYGNGTTGIVTNIALTQSAIENIKKEMEKRAKREWAIIMLLVGLVISEFANQIAG